MSTQQSGLVAGNRQNSPGGSTSRSRSKFPLSYSEFQTERFAEYFPFFVQEGVSSDRLPLHSNHEVQTYTLKSPILQSLSKNKDYFVVPMQAILPLNWEKFYTSPNIGQDVPDDCGLGVLNFWSKLRTLFNNSWTKLNTDWSNASLANTIKLEELFKFLIFFENIYSCGSLMKYLRISSNTWFKATLGNNTFATFDDIFEARRLEKPSESLTAQHTELVCERLAGWRQRAKCRYCHNSGILSAWMCASVLACTCQTS